MPFSNEGKARLKNLCQFKEKSSQRILDGFWKINGKRKRLDASLIRFGKQDATTKGMKAADGNMCVLKRTWTNWQEY